MGMIASTFPASTITYPKRPLESALPDPEVYHVSHHLGARHRRTNAAAAAAAADALVRLLAYLFGCLRVGLPTNKPDNKIYSNHSTDNQQPLYPASQLITLHTLFA